MPPIRRWLALLLLLLTLAPALSWAGPRRPEPREEAAMGRFLPTLWTFVKALWEEEGGSLDPSGQPRPNNGSDLDPSGSTGDTGSISTRTARRRFPLGRQSFGRGLTNAG